MVRTKRASKSLLAELNSKSFVAVRCILLLNKALHPRSYPFTPQVAVTPRVNDTEMRLTDADVRHFAETRQAAAAMEICASGQCMSADQIHFKTESLQ